MRESFELTRLEHSTTSPLTNEDAVLFRLQIRPTRYKWTADSHEDGRIHRPCEKLHQRLAPLSFALLLLVGSMHVLECEHRREVCSVSGAVMLSRTDDATAICAITAQHSLPPALPYPHRHCLPHGFLPHIRGERYGLTLFRWLDISRWFRCPLYAGSVCCP